MNLHHLLVALALVVLLSCQTSEQQATPTSTSNAIVPLNDTLFQNLHKVQVSQEPDAVFKRDIIYDAYPLSAVLIEAFPNWKSLINEDAVLLMRATGGYEPQMAFSDGFSGRAFVATNIYGRPADDPYDCWEEGGEEHCDLGYYFIWTDGFYPERPQPWGTYELEVVSFEEIYAKVIPETDHKPILQGFESYRKYCLECHRINDLGGSKGTEHVQRSAKLDQKTLDFFLFEYRKSNPATYMPDFSEILTTEQAAEILAYLDFMYEQSP